MCCCVCRYAASTLPELTGPFDLGPRPLNASLSWDTDTEWQDLYVQAVVNAVNAEVEGGEEGGVKRQRREMVAWARERFLWRHVAGLWMESFEKDGEEVGHRIGQQKNGPRPP